MNIVVLIGDIDDEWKGGVGMCGIVDEFYDDVDIFDNDKVKGLIMKLKDWR